MRRPPILARSARASLPLLAALAAVMPASAQVVEEPPVVPVSLNTIPVPVPDDLGDFIVDMDAALKLGKALFWDMQVGSDGVTACATCHFHAGADSRTKNQLNNGTLDANGAAFDTAFTGEGGTNIELSTAAWPFHKLTDPNDNASVLLDDFDDTFSSQGVRRVLFTSVNGVEDLGVEEADPDGFTSDGFNVRRVEPRNTPSVINAVFFHRIFHDGRANHYFNGVNPFGNQDGSATVLATDGMGGPAGPVSVLLNNAALASQAVGPPTSKFEMSWDGRNFADIGKKMLPKQPLALQEVHPMDSVFAGCVNVGGNGLDVASYAELVMQAFDAKYWEDNVTDFGGYTQMESNFSLFFGLAILKYESTLVSNDAPIDRYLDGGGEGGTASDELTALEKEGMDIFINRGDCAACHVFPTFGGAQIADVLGGVPGEGLLEFMSMANTGAEAGIDLCDQPDPEHPGEYLLPIDPRGQLLEIYGPFDENDNATTIFSAFVHVPGTVAGDCRDHDIRFDLLPWSGVPYNGAPLDAQPTMAQAFGVSVRFRQEPDENCKIRFRVDLETGFPGILPGEYHVWLAGEQVGVFDLPSANPPAVYDNGFYNIGATPTSRDVGAGGDGPFGPLSISARIQNGEDVGQPVGIDPLLLPVPGSRIAVNGAFKTPHLRNIELTGPYMHNGGLLTIEQVIDFYTGGAHFEVENLDDLDPAVGGIGGMSPERKAALAAFLKRPLTDERVLWRRAPFDHPELRVPNGHVEVPLVGTLAYEDDMVTFPAVGADGAATPLLPFHEQLTAAVVVAPFAALQIEESASPAAMGPNGAVYMRRLGDAADLAAERSIRMYFSKPPSEEVIVSAVYDDQELVCVPSQIRVTPQNWAQVQEFRVYAFRDGDMEGPETQLISWDISTTDPDYMDVALPICDVVVDDVPRGMVFQTFEAEDGSLVAPMQIVDDASASGGQFVMVPNGSGFVSNPNSGLAGQVTVTFSLDEEQAGPIRVWVLHRSPTFFDNSFYVRTDGAGPWETFVTTVTGDWQWELVNVEGTPVSFDLEAGDHSLTFAHQRDGAQIDRIVITNSPRYNPNTQ